MHYEGLFFSHPENESIPGSKENQDHEKQTHNTGWGNVETKWTYHTPAHLVCFPSLRTHVFAVGVCVSVLMFPCDDFHGTEPQNINPVKLIDHFLMSDPYQDKFMTTRNVFMNFFSIESSKTVILLYSFLLFFCWLPWKGVDYKDLIPWYSTLYKVMFLAFLETLEVKLHRLRGY